MRYIRAFFSVQVLVTFVALPGGTAVAGRTAPDWLDAHRDAASRLIGAAFADRAAWQRVAELTDTFGPRLSGSPALDRAIEWAVAGMKRDGLENVRAEPVMVPRWVRGDESLRIVEPHERPLPLLGLGGSVGTPPEGVVAEALVVGSFDELERRATEAAGKIVVYNVPYTSYGATVPYRSSGASRAARFGAAAALVRAVGPTGLRTPHTGALRYAADAPTIPAASIAAEDAEALHRMQSRGSRIRLKLVMNAAALPEVESANVIGEIVGRERPDETVVVGCHLDSWDVGTGASDDAVGCIVAWDALRLVRKLGLRPRRTLRAVLFTNEENGLRGGLAYRDRYLADLGRHVLMMEADLGVFAPLAIGFSGPHEARARIEAIVSLLSGIGIDRVGPDGGGADIGPAVEAGKVPSLSITSDVERYFLIHHTAADTVDRVEPADVSRAVAAAAVVAYTVADLAEPLASPGAR